MFTASNTVKFYIIRNEQNVYFVKGKQHCPQNEGKPEIKAWKVKTKKKSNILHTGTLPNIPTRTITTFHRIFTHSRGISSI